MTPAECPLTPEAISLREHVVELLRLRDHALGIQHEEYLRRLHDLNGEAGRLKSMQMTYLTQENYSRHHRELELRIEVALDRVQALEVAIGRIEGRQVKHKAILGGLEASMTWLVRLLLSAALIGFVTLAMNHFLGK